MIFPEHFERKTGFSEIRTILRGRCLSTLGTEWVDRKLQFMTSYEDVNRSLEEVKDYERFLLEEEDEIETELFDVREALLHVKPERTFLEEIDLFNLKRSLKTSVAYVNAFTRSDENDETREATNDDEAERRTPVYHYPALGNMAKEIATFPEIIQKIDAVLNKYGKVKDTASPKLLTLRHDVEVTMRGISHSLRSIIIEAQSSGYIDRDVSPTLRDGRLVIPVAPSLKRKIKGIVHDESATGKTVFIEPTAVVEANNRIRELRAAERREVIRILQELTNYIRPEIPAILDSLQFLAHIDFLRAVNSFSESFNCVVPKVFKRPTVDWVEARHPLLEQSLARHGEKMIPLDITFQKDGKILVISGPNAGGKSVCLKTAGLLQYMLQCGLPVPASSSSRPGLFEDIFIDIGDDQSLEDDLSTYSSHLSAMKTMMARARSRSLLLIDEFGGGTEPQIGGALAEAILERFVKTGTYGIITTHYQNLKEFAKNHAGVMNGAMLYDRAKMQPLFMLRIGNPGSSFAVEIARKIGLPEEVIQHAVNLVGQDYVISDKYLQDIVRDKAYWERKRQTLKQRQKELETVLARQEQEMIDFQKERKKIIAEAKTLAKSILDDSNAKIERTIREIKENQAEKERTKEVRSELEEFKTSVQTQSETDEAIERKIAKIQRRRERKASTEENGKQRAAKNEERAAQALNG